jgi:2-dehydropantoate 2-reductase
MNILIVGAGAIGSVYAAKLSSRHQVTVVARQAHVDAINADGLEVTGLEEMTCRVSAVVEWSGGAAPPLILLTTKVNGTAEAAARLAPFVGRETTIVCVQNGLGGEEIVKEAMRELAAEPPLVLRAITQFGAIFARPGIIDYRKAGDTLLEASPRSDAIAALFTESGLDGRVSPRIEVEVWRKLIINCVINPITSMIGADVGSIADVRLDPLKQLVIEECLAVARAVGVEFDVDFRDMITEVYGSSRNISSMRQDLMKGKATEVDFLNGAVVSLGRRLGIECPVNAALVTIIKAMEAAALKPRP